VWVTSNGGVSKASRTLHVSEDIFGGFNAVLRGARVEYYEYIQCGKGRDMGFIAVNSFEQKISTGNAMQLVTRDLYRISKGVDMFRLLSLYFTGTGFYFSTMLTIWGIYIFSLANIILVLTGTESYEEYIWNNDDNALEIGAAASGHGGRELSLAGQGGESLSLAAAAASFAELGGQLGGRLLSEAELLTSDQLQLLCEQVGQQLLCVTYSSPGETHGAGTATGEPFGEVGEPEYIVAKWEAGTYNAAHLMHLGVFLALPLFMELWLEFDVRTAIFGFVKDFFALSWFFFLFTMQTKAFHFAFGLTHGRAAYLATGRGYAMESHSVVQLYGLYAQSHIYMGMEMIIFLIIYAVYAIEATTYWLSTWAVWMTALSLVFAPWIFNPHGWTLEVVSSSFFDWLLWIDGGGSEGGSSEAIPGKGSWQAFHDDRMAMLRSKGLATKLVILLADGVPRALLVVGAMMAQKVKPSYLISQDTAGATVLVEGEALTFDIETLTETRAKVICFFVSFALWLGLSILFALLAGRGALGRLASCQTRELRWLYVLLVLSAAVVAYGVGCHYILGEELGMMSVWDKTRGPTQNSFLLALATIAAWSYVIELCDSLNPLRHGFVGRAVIGFGDVWWRGLDTMYGIALFTVLVVFTALPLAAVQGLVLYKRAFQQIVIERARRRRFLSELLG